MQVYDFIQKWHNSFNYLGLPTIGINVCWEQISDHSRINQFSGIEAWNYIYKFTPPWFKIPKTFRDLINSKDTDCLQIVKEETDNGKLEYYREKGLTDTSFCAFGNRNGSFILLGDGNHRFLDCAYLIDVEKHNFASEIEKTSLDIIYLNNFDQVIEPIKIWPSWK